MKKSGRNLVYDTYGKAEYGPVFDEGDAKTYFEWLVATVTGSKSNIPEIVKQANDQLFQFIDVLGDDIDMRKDVRLLTPYDWQALFTSFDKRLTDIRNIIDESNKSIIEVLKPLLELMKKNIKLLDILQKENERIFGKGNPP